MINFNVKLFSIILAVVGLSGSIRTEVAGNAQMKRLIFYIKVKMNLYENVINNRLTIFCR